MTKEWTGLWILKILMKFVRLDVFILAINSTIPPFTDKD